MTLHAQRRSGLEHCGVGARSWQTVGAGEIVINSIDRDGEMKGYDVDLVAEVRKAPACPDRAGRRGVAR